MSTELRDPNPDPKAKGQRKRVRKKRSSSENFMMLSRERTTWSDLLKTDRKFVAVISVLLIIGALGLVLLPRVWRATPSGVYPVIRINGLEMLRVNLATRSANAAEARGDYEAAQEGWRRAMVFNRADVTARRRYLGLCVLREIPETDPEVLRFQIRQAALLLEDPSHTLADVELSAAIYHTAELEEGALRLLSPVPLDKLSAGGLATLAGVKFQQFQFDAFRRLVDSQPRLTNAVVRLQRAAAEIIGGLPDATHAWEQLDAGLSVPLLAALTAHLQLLTATSRGDEARFNRAWAELEKTKALRPRDHIFRWQLLSRLGRSEESTRLALAFDLTPSTTYETVQIIGQLDRLGLSAKAIKYGEAYLARHRFDPMLWRELGRLMVRSAFPEDLVGFASEFARLEPEEEPQPGFASFCLGVGEHKLGHTTRAEDAFQQATTGTNLIREPMLALECADTMRRLGYREPAERLEQAVASEQGNIPGFWEQVQLAAREVRSETWLLDAARHEYQTQSTSPAVKQRYLEALLLNRTNVTEALTLATAFYQAEPGGIGQRVSLARALALQSRWAEAEQLLHEIPLEALQKAGPELLARCLLVRGEVLVELERRQDAAVILGDVNPSTLFPDELQRYQLLRQRAQ